MTDNKNLILAIVLSIAILFGFEAFFASERQPAPQVDEQGRPIQQTQQAAPDGTPLPQAPAGQVGTGQVGTGQTAVQVPSAGGTAPLPQAGGMPLALGDLRQQRERRAEVLARDSRVKIETPALTGSILLKGARFDDLTLHNYRETLEEDSPEITLLHPRTFATPYFADFGWISPTRDIALPNDLSEWKASSNLLSPTSPVTLTWENGQGLIFKRTIAIDENYMFTVNQSVENTSATEVQLRPYGLISRHGTPEVSGFFILHEGLLGVGDSQLTELDYDDIQDQRRVQTTAKTGWIGITDKYWLTSLIPNQETGFVKSYGYTQTNGVDRYQVDFVGPEYVAAPGSSLSVENRLFAGAKQVRVMDAYEESLNIDRFDLTIDWGWFYFLTRPIFYGLLLINDQVANLGVAIILLTLAIKIVFFPLANKSYAAMSKLKKLQPEMVKLRERHGDDKMKLNQEMMALYKKEGANPAAGCLPILVQIPVFFALYKVLFVTIEMRHAPFFGWVQDLSAPDPTTLFNLFGLIPWDPPSFLGIGIWPLLMGISMFLQQKLNPQPADPVQARIFLFMPILFTFLLAQFPAGLVVYWTINNVLSIAQQWVIMRRMGVKA